MVINYKVKGWPWEPAAEMDGTSPSETNLAGCHSSQKALAINCANTALTMCHVPGEELQISYLSYRKR